MARENRIDHVFVLMFENRSFDHLLGYLPHRAAHAEDPSATIAPDNILRSDVLNYNLDYRANGNPPPHVPVSNHAPAALSGKDPGHEFLDVLAQLSGPKATYNPAHPYPTPENLGFYSQYQTISPQQAQDVLACFPPERVPVVSFLAQQYALCDRWFSSAPTSTWPNRLFAIGGTSQGLDYTYTGSRATEALIGGEFDFAKGHIFSWLNKAGLTWRVYYHALPIVNLLKDIGVVKTWRNFKDYSQTGFRAMFERGLEQKGYPTFTWIEPDYGDVFHDFKGGNSQHPLDGVGHGERLIKDVYEVIRKSPLWERSVLIITYDEHGGFFDHVPPPRATKPGGDDTKYNQNKFDFSQYGVRVPSIVISPWITKPLISTTTYDHVTILKTVARLFPEQLGFIEHINPRIRDARDVMHLFGRVRREDAPTHTPDPIADPPTVLPDIVSEEAPVPDHAIPFLRLWQGVDRELHEREGVPFAEPLVERRVQSIHTVREGKQYIAEVKARLDRYRVQEGLRGL